MLVKNNRKERFDKVVPPENGGEMERKMESQMTGEWLYFAPQELTVRELYELLAEKERVEIWEEAGVLEVALGEDDTFDIESAQIHPKDEITRQFAAKQGAESVFLITFLPNDYEQAEPIMKQILGRFGGVFCGDTQDFMPQIR